MRRAEPDGARTTKTDGVSVTRHVADDVFAFPAVVYRISSSRDRPVTVRLVQQIPDCIGPRDVGFHPSFGSECWTLGSGEATFECTLDPGTRYTTVCAVRSTRSDRATSLFDAALDIAVERPGSSPKSIRGTSKSTRRTGRNRQDQSVKAAIDRLFSRRAESATADELAGTDGTASDRGADGSPNTDGATPSSDREATDSRPEPYLTRGESRSVMGTGTEDVSTDRLSESESAVPADRFEGLGADSEPSDPVDTSGLAERLAAVHERIVDP